MDEEIKVPDNGEIETKTEAEALDNMPEAIINAETEPGTEEEPPPPPPVKAEAQVIVSADELLASIRIKPPENGGADLTFAELKIALVKNGVMFGIDNAAIKNLADNPVYSSDVVVARGVQKQDGTDATLIYNVEMDHKLKPKEKDDGTIDFKDLGTVQEAKMDQVLCEKIPATPGVPGTTVKNREIAPVPGKDKAMPAGKNTATSEDHNKLLATLDGHISVVSGKINILEIFVVSGDVSSQTGNIAFSGNVIVKGDVSAGFSVQAAGDLTVNGAVESAKITAGGALIIRGGFRGGENGSLDVGGNAACSFIEGGHITLKGNLETSYIINATVKCGGPIILSGRGLIRGGHIIAREAVTANYIGGNVSASTTVIEVGSDPDMLERFKIVNKEIETYDKNMKDVELVVNSLMKLKEINRLPPEKESTLERAAAYTESIQETYLSLKEEHEAIKEKMAEIGFGKINVKKTAYPGLKILMGTDVLTLQQDHTFVTFLRGSEGITFTPLQ